MITLVIIVLTVIFSVLSFFNTELFAKFKFHPYSIKDRKEWYRFFSYGFIHADWAHLLVNMFVLYSFGSMLEELFSQLFGYKSIIYFIVLYVSSIMASVIPSYDKNKNDIYYAAVGASGAVSAILFSFMLIKPLTPIALFLIPIPIPAFIFGFLYLIFSAYMAKRNVGNIGHDAHFFGAIYGVFTTILFKPSLMISFYKQIISFF